MTETPTARGRWIFENFEDQVQITYAETVHNPFLTAQKDWRTTLRRSRNARDVGFTGPYVKKGEKKEKRKRKAYWRLPSSKLVTDSPRVARLLLATPE